MKARPILALITFLPLLALACGSTDESEGAGGAAPVNVACYIESQHFCWQLTTSPVMAGDASAACSSIGSTASETCPTAGLSGCCKATDGAGCYYTGTSTDEAMLMDECAMQMGTWSTTP